MVAASCSFAAMAATVKLASASASPWAVVWVRSAVIVGLALGLLRARRTPIRFTDHRMLLVRALSGFAAMGFYFWALGNAPLADAVTLQYTSPLFVAVLAPFTVRERVTPRTVGWLLFGFAGVVLVVRPHGEPSPGALAALASAALAAVAYLSVRTLRRTEHPDVIVLHFAIVSTLLSTPAVPGLLRDPPTGSGLVALLAVGGFAAGGQLGMTRAYRYGEAAVVSGFSYVTVALGIVAGAVLFGEPPSPWSLVGAALVAVAGIALARS